MRLHLVSFVVAAGVLTGCALNTDSTGSDRAPTTATSVTIVVTPAALSGWAVQTSGTSAVSFVAGPAPAPLGTGSAALAVGSNGNGAAQLRNASFGGTRLADLTALRYSTHVSNFMGCQAGYVILNVDNNGDGTVDDQLFFEPCYQTGAYGGDPIPAQGAPVLNSWQTWDALRGGWWAVSAGTFGPPLVTLASYVQAHPNATIRNSATGLGGVRIVAGFGAGAWDNFAGNVDAVVIGVGSTTTTYDFEPATACATRADTATSTITLLADCTTDRTVLVPNGWTFDGAGHTLTAVDPAGDHFRGAVVRNGGAVAHVRNLRVTASNLADVCDAGGDRLRGILFEGARGTITDNVVVDINQGRSGCQEGNGIEARNEPFDATGSDLAVTISGNTVRNYQKGGIVANGSVAATITGNTVEGAGPVDYIAQNGIQVGFGGTADIRDNAVSGNDYTPSSYVSCGVLYYQADGVRASRNHLTNNERQFCNSGERGGGTFNPNP